VFLFSAPWHIGLVDTFVGALCSLLPDTDALDDTFVGAFLFTIPRHSVLDNTFVGECFKLVYIHFLLSYENIVQKLGMVFYPDVVRDWAEQQFDILVDFERSP